MVGQEEGQREEEEDSYFLRINATATKQTITDVPCGCSYSSHNLFKCITFVIKSPSPLPPRGRSRDRSRGSIYVGLLICLKNLSFFFDCSQCQMTV